MATLKDIAKLTECATSTISRVLNNDPKLSVSDDVKNRIFAAAKELDYKLPKHRNGDTYSEYRVGVLVWYNEYEEIEFPYYISIRQGIERQCAENSIGCEILYMDQGYQDKISNLDGLILVGKFSEKFVEEVGGEIDKIVLVDYYIRGYDCIITDFEEATIDVINLAKSMNHKEIGLLIRKELVDGVPIEDKRLTTYCNYLGLENSDKNIHVGHFVPNSGYELMTEAIKQGNLPSAFFCASDSIALGAMRAIKENGLNIPEDIGLIGFGDLPSSKYMYPALTTVKVETEYMGTSAVNVMKEKLTSENRITKKIIVPTTLMVRESITDK